MRPVLLNGVVIGHWDEEGRWHRKPNAAPYSPRMWRKFQQRLAGGPRGDTRPLRNMDRHPASLGA